MIIQSRYHIQFQGRRTTITVDSIVSELLAVKLGVLPDEPSAHGLVRDWLEATLGSSAQRYVTHHRILLDHSYS